MKLLKRIKKLKKKASSVLEKHHEPIKIALKDNFNSEAFVRLRKGKIVISREMLRFHIKEALAKDPFVDLDYIACTETGVKIGVLIRKYKTSLTAEIGLFIKKAAITFDEQKIVIKIHSEKVIGNNISGIMISAFVGTIISEIVKKTVFSVDLPIHYNKKHNTATLDLSAVAVVRRMKQPVIGSKSVLEFISVTGAEHTDAGIVIKCRIKVF
jgi:hypothetical protein